MKLLKITFLSISILFFTACSTAGPYVTNISSDGNGGMNIEKCKVKYNALFDFIDTGDCISSSLKLSR